MINKDIFVKAHNLPIKILIEPYFSASLEALENNFQAKTKFEHYVEIVNSIPEFEKKYYGIRNEIINHILEKPEYDEFNHVNLEPYKSVSSIKEGDIYIAQNDNEIFLSFDLVKANFQALRYFNPNIVDNCLTYKDFISQFTDIDFIINSKYIRQYMFGNLNPKRVVVFEKYLINKIFELSSFNEILKSWDIVIQNKDEIILKVKNKDNLNIENEKIIINQVIQEMREKFQIELYGSIFQLKLKKFLTQLEKTIPVYIKEFLTEDKVEYKNIPQIYYMQVYKMLNNLPINENDLLFINENELCRVLKPLTLIN